MKLFIDDLRSAYDDGWLVCRSGESAMEMLDEYIFDMISFDNDLGEGPQGEKLLEGYDVLCYLEMMWRTENRPKPREIRIHTANSVARNKMEACLRANNYFPAGAFNFNTDDFAQIWRLR
jgi:hypothetical protein